MLATRLPLAPALLLWSLGFCRFTEAGFKLLQFALPFSISESCRFIPSVTGSFFPYSSSIVRSASRTNVEEIADTVSGSKSSREDLDRLM